MTRLNRFCARWLSMTWLLLTGLLFIAGPGYAQEDDLVADPDPVTPSVSDTPASTNNAASTTGSGRSAVVSLQTTVTGNQEQPRVLYILPWQSPAASDVDFELFDSQETAVFGHIERNELRRELEAAGEFD